LNLGISNEPSIFRTKSLSNIYEEIRNVYLKYPQPWVVGYSGGKDSTAVVQLVWNALKDLDEEKRQKPVFVIASDTQVEMPVIIKIIEDTIHKINQNAALLGLPFKAQKVKPNLQESYWINLIGRGYPAPTTRFRWCTERMKINPTNRFIHEKVTQFGEVIMVLGVRKSESSTRMQLMNSYQVKDHILRRHSSLPGAYIYAPIADFTTEDVWGYLLDNPSPWGGSNEELYKLYRNANAGECPLVIDDSTPSCGYSRFGCWVCTVATRDTSMESLVERGEEWMKPLLEIRDLLASTTDPDQKLKYRDIRGRDGRVIIKKDGKPAARTFKLEFNKELLKQLLKAQIMVRQNGPNPNLTLITDEELIEIRRIWRTERQDWEDSITKIFKDVYGFDLEWLIDDDVSFGLKDRVLLENICKEYGVPFPLIAMLIEEEKKSFGMTQRGKILKRLTTVLGYEWRDEAAIMNDDTKHH
jgi:DNA sulfur modification protein DndC